MQNPPKQLLLTLALWTLNPFCIEFYKIDK